MGKDVPVGRGIGMLIYIFMLVLVIGVFVYRELRVSSYTSRMAYAVAEQPKGMLILMFVILLFISTFRADHIGADHERYVLLFQDVGKTGTLYFAKNGEIGYVLLNKIAHFFSNEGYCLNFFVTIIFLTGCYIYIKRCIDPSYWSMAVLVIVLHPYLYIQSTFNAMRQCCAMGIVMIAGCLLQQKRKFWFVVLCIVAATFHKSAIVMLLLLVIYNIPWNKMLHQIIAVSMLVINFLQTEKLIAYIASWLNYDMYSSYEASVLDNKVYTLFIGAVLLILLYKYDKLYVNAEEKLFVDIYLLSMSFLLFAVTNDMLYRIYMYMALLSLPGITIISKNASRFVAPAAIVRYLYVAYYACFYIGYIGLLWFNQNEHYVPFLFVWNV